MVFNNYDLNELQMSYDNLLSERLNQAGIFLLLLVSTDVGFIIAYLVHEFSPFLGNRGYSLTMERGYSEIFQYVKTYWIIIMLAALWWRTREYVYIAWMLLFTYLLADDAFEIHERGGHAIAIHWTYESSFGISAQDFGELTVSGVSGLVLLVLILITYLRSTRDARNVSKDLTLLVGALVFFGVMIDILLHRIAVDSYSALFGIAEDGGEMFAMSAVCWYVFNLVEHRGNVPTSLWQLTKTALSYRLKGRILARH